MIFIYSYGGHAREFARLVRIANPGHDVIFIDDGGVDGAVSYQQALALKGDQPAQVSIGFSDGRLRRRKTAQVLQDGFSLLDVIAPTAIVGDNVTIGAGAILSDFSMVTADAKIGRSFHANMYSYITHDCVVGDFVTLAPRVSVNGRVVIEGDVYIGTGATILPGNAQAPITIGKGAVIGAHALVTRDVAPGVTVVGAPARPFEKK